MQVPQCHHAPRPVPEDAPDRGDVRPGCGEKRGRRVAKLVPAASVPPSRQYGVTIVTKRLPSVSTQAEDFGIAVLSRLIDPPRPTR